MDILCDPKYEVKVSKSEWKGSHWQKLNIQQSDRVGFQVYL